MKFLYMDENARIIARACKNRELIPGDRCRSNGGKSNMRVIERRAYRVAIVTKKVRFANP